jgi:hypothetical protein
VFDEDSVFQKSSEKVKDIYQDIKEKISSWNDISFNSTPNYVSVLKNNKVKIYLVPQKSKLKIDMVRRIDFKGNVDSIPIKFTLDDPKNLFKLLVNEYKELYTMSFDDNKDIDYIVLMLKQKFDS